MARRSDPDVQLNLNVRGMPLSATLAINERSAALQREGRAVHRLGLGQSPFPVPDIVVETLREHAHEKDYLPVRGLTALREAVAEHQQRECDIECSAEDVIVGPGSKELMFLLQLVYYGDIVIPTPAWVSYAPQARIIGRHVHFLATDPANSWRLTPKQLDALCRIDPGRPMILVLNYPSNPTGATYPADELEALARVARRHKVVLLSDEIYGNLHHTGDHRSVVPMYERGTIFSGGLSKWCGAGGWRLGVFVVPSTMRWLLDSMAAVASETFTSTSAPIQYAAVQAFRGDPSIELYLQRCRRLLRALGRHLTATLRSAGVDVVEPEGGFYLFPDFSACAERLERRGIVSSPVLTRRLLEDTGVAVLPGSDFGCPPDRLAARLAYVDFDGAAALRAMADSEDTEPDEAFLRSHCSSTVTAVEKLCDWLG